MSDYQCQLVAIEAMRAIEGDDFRDPRLVSQHGVFKGRSNGRFQKKKTGIPTGLFTVPYLLHAYDVSETSFKRQRKARKEGTLLKAPGEQTNRHRGTSVINNSELSKERFNAQYFFVRQKVLSEEPPKSGYVGPWETPKVRQKYWGAVYNERVSRGEINDRDENHRLARAHLARQASIEEELLEALRANVCTSFRSLSRYINGWCSAATIKHWFKQHEDYHIYRENVNHSLKLDNEVKQSRLAS